MSIKSIIEIKNYHVIIPKKNKYFLILLCFLIPCCLFAQAWQSEKQYILLGVGENKYYINTLEEEIETTKRQNPGNYGIINIKSTPGFFGKVEYALSKHIGLGFVFAYRKTIITQVINYSIPTSTVIVNSYYSYILYKDYTDYFKYTFSDASLGLRFNIHILHNKLVDPYIGIAGGYRLWDFSVDQTSSNPKSPKYVFTFDGPIPIYLAGTVGLRWFFAKKYGLYAEVGLDKFSRFQGGFIFKVNNGQSKQQIRLWFHKPFSIK